MSRLLLDTTVLIDGERSATGLDRLIGDDDLVAVAAATIAELRVGVLFADPVNRKARASYVDDVISAIPVLDYDLEVAEAHAALLAEVRRVGTPRGAHDLMIAATARAFSLTVVSADRRGFDGLPGVEVRSPD